MLETCTMTRQHRSVALPCADDNGRILVPLRPVRNLTEAIILRIKAEIAAGRLTAGMRLPTEQDMMGAMGVSRTVVREAVAALRAEGLVTTRQGSGAFVAADTGRRGFRIDADGLGTLDDVLHVLELRLAIELEAAALAAERASAAGVRAIYGALKAFEAAVQRGEQAVIEDFAFHRAIAKATRNPHFCNLLEFLGHFIIPRHTIRAADATADARVIYLRQIFVEHQAIYKAIHARQPARAREAMRAHLGRSKDRYRAFAERRGRGHSNRTPGTDRLAAAFAADSEDRSKK